MLGLFRDKSLASAFNLLRDELPRKLPGEKKKKNDCALQNGKEDFVRIAPCIMAHRDQQASTLLPCPLLLPLPPTIQSELVTEYTVPCRLTGPLSRAVSSYLNGKS